MLCVVCMRVCVRGRHTNTHTETANSMQIFALKLFLVFGLHLNTAYWAAIYVDEQQ